MNDVLLLGVGNLLWADEGFGPRCVEALVARYHLPEGVVAMDGGTQGLLLVDPIQRARRVLIFDAIDYGLVPGTLRLIPQEQISQVMAARKMSLHQATMQDVLACVQLLGGGPEDIALIGMQPVELEDYGGSLSAPVRAQLDAALALAEQVLAGWGHPLRAREALADPDAVIAPALRLDAYEAGRPSAEEACRIGDGRVLARSA